MENITLLTSQYFESGNGQHKAANRTEIEHSFSRKRNEVCSQSVYGECGGNMNLIDHEMLPTVNNSGNHDNSKQHGGKEAHFFASYCSEDRERVVPLIQNLEREFNVRCLFDERDFKPGMQIHENIKRAMDKSMKMLLFISENFKKSNFCRYEMDQAFVMSMEMDDSYIIPVLLEECEIPSTIKTLTYVDATRYESNVSVRIIEAFKRKGPSVAASTIEMVDSNGHSVTTSTVETVNKKVENGFDIDLVKTETNCCTGFMGEKAVLSYASVQAIQAAEIEVPVETFQRAVDILNSVGLKKRWVVNWIFITLSEWALQMALFVTFGQPFFKVDIPSPTVAKMMQAPAQLLFGAFAPLIIAIAMLPYYRYRQNKDLRILSERLFYENTMGTYRHGVFFHVVFRRSVIVHLHTTKYLASLMTRCVEKILNKTTDSSEIFNTCADAFLEENLRWLISDPPEHAPTVRHLNKAGKKCFCQRIEPLLNDENIMDFYNKYNEV